MNLTEVSQGYNERYKNQSDFSKNFESFRDKKLFSLVKSYAIAILGSTVGSFSLISTPLVAMLNWPDEAKVFYYCVAPVALYLGVKMYMAGINRLRDAQRAVALANEVAAPIK